MSVHRSTLELTPVEFACETMANVERELLDLIGQYRAEPAKNINPFSMRLQGCIDANVMGGISKYQAAFFSEEFARSAEGRSQLANVHRLRCLIADQVGVLETALELHGQLAPAGVQPLHQRLCERFGQLRDSLAATTASATAAKMAAAVRRPNSDSIVNTPLPPLPTEATAAATVGRQPPQQQRSASMDQQQQVGWRIEKGIFSLSGSVFVTHSYHLFNKKRCRVDCVTTGNGFEPPSTQILIRSDFCVIHFRSRSCSPTAMPATRCRSIATACHRST